MTTRNPTWIAEDYRLYNDTGAAGSSALANQNAAGSVANPRKFRLRVAVGETNNANTANVGAWVLQAIRNGGTPFTVTTSSTFVKSVASDAAEFVDGNALTQALGGVTGSAAYQSTWSEQDENGAVSSRTWTDDDTEYEYALQLDGCSPTDTITFRMLSPSSSTAITFANVPTVNVTAQTFTASVSGGMTAAGAATTATLAVHSYVASGGMTAAGAATTSRVAGSSPRDDTLITSLVAAVAPGKPYSIDDKAATVTGERDDTLITGLVAAVVPGKPYSIADKTGASGVYSYTGSGGLTTGGAAVVAVAYTLAYIGSGGMTAAGAATAAPAYQHPYVASGGVTAGGAATTAPAYQYPYVGSGGLTAGGAATTALAASFAFTASGGMTLGGAADAAHASLWTVSGTGGMTLGGSADLVVEKVYGASGGLTAAGAAVTSFQIVGATTYTYAGSGGATLAGAADTATSALFAYAGSGGVVAAGAAETSVTHLFTYLPAGGLVLAGSAETAATSLFAYAATGGVTAAGAAETRYQSVLPTEYAYTASGGLVAGGTAGASWRSAAVVQPASGGYGFGAYDPELRRRRELQELLEQIERLEAHIADEREVPVAKVRAEVKRKIARTPLPKPVKRAVQRAVDVPTLGALEHAETVLKRLQEQEEEEFAVLMSLALH